MDKIYNSEEALKIVHNELKEFEQHIVADSRSTVNKLHEQSKEMDDKFKSEINALVLEVNGFIKKVEAFVKENTEAISERQHAINDYTNHAYKKTNII